MRQPWLAEGGVRRSGLPGVEPLRLGTLAGEGAGLRG